jgi:hypothetical protein
VANLWMGIMLTRILHENNFLQALAIATFNLFNDKGYSQGYLIDRINLFLRQQKRRQMDDSGHCHGLAILWLKRIAEGREEEFYQMIKEIIDCPETELHKIAGSIDKMRRSMDKKQYPRRHYYRYSYFHMDYPNIDLLLKAQKQTVFDGAYTITNLENLFNESINNEDMICISTDNKGKNAENHTIGVFKRNETFYLYDSNFLSGRAYVYRTADSLVSEILSCLYTSLCDEIPEILNLQIKCTRYPEKPLMQSVMNKEVSHPPGFLNQFADYLFGPVSTADKRMHTEKVKLNRKQIALEWQRDGANKKARKA